MSTTREIRGIKVEEVDFSKQDISRRSLLKDYFYVHRKMKPTLHKTEQDFYSNNINKIRRRPSDWINGSFQVETDPYNDKYKCSYCDLVVPSLSYLNNHLLIHTGMRQLSPIPSQRKNKKYYTSIEKPFTCNKCSIKFKKEANLYRHVKNIHKTAFECEMCKGSFESKNGLINHWQENICQYIKLEK